MLTTPPKILVADSSEAVEAIRLSLTSSFELVSVGSMAQARQALAEAPAVVVCGCHFDEGRMYDLLRYLKGDPQLARVPFMAIRATEGELEDALYESVKIAVRALGGNAFVDLMRWQRKLGPAEAAHRLTQLLLQLAHSPGIDTA